MGYSTRESAAAFAGFVKAKGFRVFMAKAGTYGFVTDESESRVLSFSFTDGGSLSGNYGPPSTSSGSGWRMDDSPWDLRSVEDIRRALYARPPEFCGRGWKHLTTVKQHLAMYGDSSNYVEV
jgi:hypothetical protein